MNEKVGIILPVRNAERTIARSVDSVLKQTFEDFKLYCVVNGTTDNTVAVLNSFNDKRLIVVESPMAGLVPALNFGLQKIDCQYVARQDSDDFWYPEKLEKQIKFLDDNKDIAVLGCQIRLVDGAGKQLENQGHRYPTDDSGIRQSLLGGWNSIPHPGVVFRKELLLRTGGYDDTYHMAEDYYLWLRAMKWFKFSNLHDVLIDYTAVHNPNYDPRVAELLWQSQHQIKNLLSTFGR